MTNNNRLYIIHPLETYGDEKQNRKEEQEIAEFLKGSTDFELVRPFKLIPPDMPREKAMIECLYLLKDCDNVILTGDWYLSEGCVYELAQVTGQDIYALDNWNIKRLN